MFTHLFHTCRETATPAAPRATGRRPSLGPAFLAAALAPALLVSGGCATKSHDDRMEAPLEAFKVGNYALAAEEIAKVAEASDDPNNHDSSRIPRDGLLARLEQGTILRAAGDIRGSIRAFERANEILAMVEEAARVRGTEEAAATLTNDTARTYRGTQYDRIMLSLYLALNHLELGDFETARVYLRQTGERQEWARQRFDTEIAEQQAAANESAGGRVNVAGLLGDEAFQSKVEAAGDAVPLDLGYYAGFQNPYANFMEGVTFLATGVDRGDLERGSQGFDLASGLERRNPFLPVLAEVADEAADRGVREPLVHVVYEQGLAPWRDEFKIAIPAVFILPGTSNIGTPTIALPVLKWGPAASPYVEATAGGNTFRTSRLVSIDGIVKAEYDVEYPAVLSRAIASTVAKTLLTTGVNVGAREVGAQVGGLGELAIRVGSWIGTSAYQVGTTSADARTWMTLPKEVQIASFEEPADLTVHLDVGNHGRTITLDDGATGHVIFIRKPTASAVPSIRSVSLFPGFDGEFDLARETAPGTDGYVGGARLE